MRLLMKSSRHDAGISVCGAYLWKVDLDGADFTKARLDKAKITDVDLRMVKGLRPEQISKIERLSLRLRRSNPTLRRKHEPQLVTSLPFNVKVRRNDCFEDERSHLSEERLSCHCLPLRKGYSRVRQQQLRFARSASDSQWPIFW